MRIYLGYADVFIFHGLHFEVLKGLITDKSVLILRLLVFRIVIIVIIIGIIRLFFRILPHHRSSHSRTA